MSLNKKIAGQNKIKDRYQKKIFNNLAEDRYANSTKSWIKQKSIDGMISCIDDADLIKAASALHRGLIVNMNLYYDGKVWEKVTKINHNKDYIILIKIWADDLSNSHERDCIVIPDHPTKPTSWTYFRAKETQQLNSGF